MVSFIVAGSPTVAYPPSTRTVGSASALFHLHIFTISFRHKGDAQSLPRERLERHDEKNCVS